MDGATQQASLTFTGRKYGILVRRTPSSGMADVYVDGTFVQRVDLYSATNQDRIYILQKTVTDEPHTVTIVWTGAKNANSTGTAISLDGIGLIGTG